MKCLRCVLCLYVACVYAACVYVACVRVYVYLCV